MRYHKIRKMDISNGPGVRVSIFMQGCEFHCENCFNKETWDFNYGYAYTDDVEDRIITELQKPYYEGITILGGDPFELVNQKGVLQLIERVKKDCPNKDIWMYTGYLYNVDLMPNGCRYIPYTTDKILNLIDILVDGRFELDKKDLKLNFRGSSNQRIIEMESTRRTGNIVLSNLNN